MAAVDVVGAYFKALSEGNFPSAREVNSGFCTVKTGGFYFSFHLY